MNRVTPQTPLEEIVALIERDGYVLMENALNPLQVAEISAAYEEQLNREPVAPGTKRIEIKRILERDLRFEQLIDHPATFAVARAVIGADIELASGGELDHKMPQSPAHIGWHNDFSWMTNVPYPRQNFWIRCTYFLSDVTTESGPFTLLPGTHRMPNVCPGEWHDENGQPVEVKEQIPIIGPAGSCLINNTEIWHTNTPNVSEKARQLIMILYKHAWMKQWQEGYALSEGFALRQSDPLRRQLCGLYTWHLPASTFPANDYGK